MSSKTKILVCGILPPPFFGHSMMYQMLMESDFVRAFDVIFFNMKFWSYESHKKVTFAKILKLIRYYCSYIFLILRRRPAYILFNMSFDKMPFFKDYLFCLTGRLLGCRIVLHDMGQYLQGLYENANSFYRFFIRHLLKLTSASIVLGFKTRHVYQGFLELERVFTVPGVVTDTWRTTSPASEPHREESKIQVLYFSFLSQSKGIWTALEAAVEVVKANKNIVFIFAGPVESERLREEIDSFIGQHLLDPYVRRTGYIDEEDKRTELYRWSDIFIFPTQRDVFGLVILHAMAEGKAVVASDEGAICEIIDEGKTGFLIPKGNAKELAEKILTLAADKSLREKMGQAARQKYLSEFTPEKYGQHMIETFEKIRKLP